MLRAAPILALVVLIGPLAFGLLATILPAFGYFPALGGTQFSLNPFRDLFGQPGFLESILLSLWTGLITTAISVAIVALFVAGWSNTRGFRLLQSMVSPLLSVPHAAAAFGLAFMIAPSGWIMRLVSPELTGMSRPPDWLILHDPMGLSMIAGLVIKEIPFLFLVTLAALPQVQPRRNLQAAVNLGYGRTAGFLYAVWPRIYPQIRLAIFAVIAYSSSVVDVALILGPTQPAPLSVRLVNWMSDPDLGLRFRASAGALVQLGVTGFVIIVWIGLEKLFGLGARSCANRGYRFTSDKLLRQTSLTSMSISALLVVAGLVVLAVWSFAGYWQFPDALPRSFSLKTWDRQLDNLARPMWITISVGLAATILAAVISLACLEREARTGRSGGSRAMTLLYLPLIVPQASFVFGLQLFFLVVGMDATFASLVLVHVVFVLPYLFLSLADPWRAWDQRYAQAALAMGSGRNRIFWRIRLPMLMRSVLVASAVGFAVSVGQYLPTILVGAGRWPTITTEAVALSSGGDRRVIGVYAFMQMGLPFLGFLLASLVPTFLFLRRRDMRAAT